MSVHITKTYNIGGLIGLRQNAVKNAGETLGFKEMSLFKFPDAYDSDDELHVRMDGIIASLCPEGYSDFSASKRRESQIRWIFI